MFLMMEIANSYNRALKNTTCKLNIKYTFLKCALFKLNISEYLSSCYCHTGKPRTGLNLPVLKDKDRCVITGELSEILDDNIV